MIHYLNSVNDLTINDSSFVVKMKYKVGEKIIVIDHLTKIFIKVSKQTKTIYLFIVSILTVVLFYLLDLLVFNVFFAIFILITFLLLLSIIKFRQYQVVIKLKNGKKHTYYINTNNKTRIIEQVRKIKGIKSQLFNN